MHIAVLVYGRLDNCLKQYNNVMETIGKEHDLDFFASSDNSQEIDSFINLN